jgi:exopolysaccharide biosynthesis polyprenyl glycosylphosphotransferase
VLLKSKRALIDLGRFLFDAAAFGIAAAASLLVASDIDPAVSGNVPLGTAGLFVLVAGLLAGQLVSGPLPSTRLSAATGSLRRTALRAAVSTAVLAVGGIAVRAPLLTSQAFLVSVSILQCALLLGSGVVMEASLRLARRYGRNLRHVVILGSGPRAAEIAEAIWQRPELGYNLVGFVDDRMPVVPLGLKHLGRLEDLAKLLSEGAVDEVFVALPIRSFYDWIHQCVALCEEWGIAVHLDCDLFTVTIARSTLASLGTRKMISHRSSGPMDGVPYLIKRGLDIVGASISLILLLPLFIGISLAILFSMGRPVFYRQPRVGYLRRIFPCFKFRTMVRGAEDMMEDLEELNELDGPAFKLSDDPRVTPLGRFLRRSSLDELPQLFNVLRGEMSLVGPRPLPLRDVEGFDRGGFHRRFSICPGMTCTWQISGRSLLNFEDWIRLDLEYIDNWTLRRDLEILLATVPAVLKRNGAY